MNATQLEKFFGSSNCCCCWGVLVWSKNPVFGQSIVNAFCDGGGGAVAVAVVMADSKAM